MLHRNVRPPITPLTEHDARKLLSDGIFKTVHTMGPSRYAQTVRCDERTARKARDADTTLRLDHAFNTLLADPGALDCLLAHYGLRAAPLEANVESDLLTPAAAVVHKLAQAMSPDSPGGAEIVDSELAEMEPEVDAALYAMSGIKARIHRYRARLRGIMGREAA